jgi:hypothetical protein
MGLGLSLQVAQAAGPDCTADEQSCQFTRMQFLDQTDSAIDPEHDDWLPNGKSMLCGPTTAVMVIDAALEHAQELKPRVTGWTATQYLPHDWIGRVKAMARKLLTSPKDGTWVPLNFPFAEIGRHIFVNDREAGKAIGEIVWPNARNETFIKNIRWGYVPSMAYGHYEKQVARILGQEIITFGRQGGHIVAVQGFTHFHGKPILAINNPHGARRDWRTTEPMSSGIRWRGWFKSTITIVPHIFGTGHTLYREGNQFKFIDGYYGLGILPAR